MNMKECVVRFGFLLGSTFLFERRGCRNVWLEFYTDSDTITTIETRRRCYKRVLQCKY